MRSRARTIGGSALYGAFEVGRAASGFASGGPPLPPLPSPAMPPRVRAVDSTPPTAAHTAELVRQMAVLRAQLAEAKSAAGTPSAPTAVRVVDDGAAGPTYTPGMPPPASLG